mgnify:CR=1 FL=1
MYTFRLALLLGMLATLCACVEDITADDTQAFTTLAQGNYAQSDDKRIQVLNDQAAYDEVYLNLLNQSSTPQTIDFSRYQVLLVMTGAGYTVNTLKVERFNGLAEQVQVQVFTEYAGSNCPVVTVVTQPWLLVLFPRVEKPLLINERAAIKNC